jgi:hypothetical protein
MNSKSYELDRNAETNYNLEWREYILNTSATVSGNMKYHLILRS